MDSYFYRNPRLMLLAIALIAVSGLSSFFILPRMEDPALVQRGAFINTQFPGAEPSRVESLVSEKIEDALSEIDEIKEIRSTSREGISTIAIELLDEVIESDPVWSKIRDKVSNVEAELPDGAFPPVFDEMDFKAFSVLSAIRWDQPGDVNYAVMQRWAKQLEDSLAAVAGTEKAELFGDPTEEILVLLDEKRIVGLGLTVGQVAASISQGDAKVSAGQIRGSEEDLLIQVSGELDSVQRIQEILVRSDSSGNAVRVSDIAEVRKTIADPPESIAIVEGQRSIVVGAFVRANQRVDLWSKRVEKKLDEFEATLPHGLILDRMFNQNDYVEERLTTLLINLFAGGCAVFLVIFFMMGWRSAICVSTALPLASMIVLAVMRFMEIPVHQMSITGLIIALGLLIDNAIVIVDETSTRLRSGIGSVEAVAQSVSHLRLPLLGSTLTTAFAFAPIALMPGPAGEFVGAIAVTVIAAIAGSFVLSMTIVPAVAAMLAPKPDDSGNYQRTFLKDGFASKALTNVYKRTLDFFFAYPAIGVVFGVVLPVLGFVAAQELPEQFFPPSDRDQIHLELELAPQSSLAATLETTKQIREALLEEPEVKRVDWFVGESAPAFYYNLIPRRVGVSQYAQALIKLESFQNQSQLIHRLQAKLDQQFSHSRILVRQLEQGPPFDAPVEVRLFGPDLETLQQLGGEVRSILVNTPGVVHTRAELDDVLPKVAFDINEDKARAAGLNLTDIAFQLNASTAGAFGGSVVEATEELPVRIRLNDSNRSALNSVASLSLVDASRSPMQATGHQGIPISAIANVKLEPEYGSITHLAGRRLNEIQVYIPAGVLPSKVLSAFQVELEKSDLQLPQGYFITYGGEAAKRDEAVSNLLASVGVLIVLMIATLVLSFGSFRVATIIGVVGMLSIGLGLGALWVFGHPFGFTAIIGSMGLMGVAINDTIVVLAAIRDDEAASSGDRVAMREVVNKATRHIVSTSLTTMAGFSPLIIGGGGFWPPMAVAIAGGVAGATVLALILSPSAYLLLMCRRREETSLPSSPSAN